MAWHARWQYSINKCLENKRIREHLFFLEVIVVTRQEITIGGAKYIQKSNNIYWLNLTKSFLSSHNHTFSQSYCCTTQPFNKQT